MKKYIISVLAASCLITACKKNWLEVIPEGMLIATKVDDYEKIMNDFTLYNASSGGGWQELQLMGDEIAAEGAFFSNRNPVKDNLFQWADTIWSQNNPNTAFALTNSNGAGHTKIMYVTNQVINNVMNATEGTEAAKKAVRAEARATRAFTLFNMANFYCKPYRAGTAATDPGMPFSTEADITQTSFPRGTLQATYDFIITDLQEALKDIPVKQTFVTRMSKPAVEGLLGKVYMFMGRFNEALPHLNAALADITANGQTALYDYNVTLTPGGSFLPVDPVSGPVNAPQQNFTDMKESVLHKFYYSGAGFTQPFGNDGLVLSPATQALFGASDLRLLLYSNTNPDNSINAGGRLRKYSLRYSRFGLQLPDLYLLQAECKARLNDLTGAKDAVEIIRKHRMPVSDAILPSAVAGNQLLLIRFIIDERTREFAMEGMRWFDMRRLSADPLFAGITFKHTLYNPDGSTTEYTLQQPNRLTLKWPRVITDANQDMQDNP